MEEEVVMTDLLDQPTMMEVAPATVLARKIPTAELAVELMERPGPRGPSWSARAGSWPS